MRAEGRTGIPRLLPSRFVRVLVVDFIDCGEDGVAQALCYFVTGIDHSNTLPCNAILLAINKIDENGYFGCLGGP